MDSIKRAVANGASYITLYIIGMVPTYFLPYLGSNSFLAQGINSDYSRATGHSGIFIYFLMHLGCLAALAMLAKFRGDLVGKRWIVVFPILAAVFDFVPGLSLIPMIPTFMHLLAIIIGVASSRIDRPKQG